MRGLWKPGYFERGGNTKTHGIVRAEFTVRDDLPGAHAARHLRRAARPTAPGCASPGPGPYVTPDIDDVGFMSMSIKLMGVPGPKLLDDEQFTQDMIGVSTPTFVTPDTRANAQLQHWSYRNASAFYFLNLARVAHPRLDHAAALDEDAVEPARGRVLQLRPVPARRGAGDAVLVPHAAEDANPRAATAAAARPTTTCATRWWRRSPSEDVEFDILLQVQTDPFLMPIENNAVLWPTKLSPRVPAAVLRIPRQTFDSPEQLDFARVLSFNPWHCIPEHRPLGNQSRARKRMYSELSRLRQQMNGVEHYEPTGDEEFPGSPPDPGEVAQRREAGQEEVGAALDRDEARDVRHALADALGRDRERPAVRHRRRDDAGPRRRRAGRTSGCSSRCG